jgi:hypothetical protein
MNPLPCWFWIADKGGTWQPGIVHAFMDGSAVVTAGPLDAPGGKRGEGQPRMVKFEHLRLGEKQPNEAKLHK